MKTKRASLTILLIVASLTVLFGCEGADVINKRIELVEQLDNLLAAPNSDLWKESKGRFYYPISNGAIRTDLNGSVYLITDLYGSNNYSCLLLSNPNDARATKIARKFGIKTLTKEAINRSSEIQTDLLKDAITEISNKVKESVIFEEPQEISK